MEAASNMQTAPDCKHSSANSKTATSNMHIALNLQATQETDFLDMRVCFASKGNSEQDLGLKN